MLTKEENDLLTQVGPGTPMGELIRRYWIPAIRSSELPDPNCDPVRVRLVGENFVAWRDQDGRVGLFDEYCMHRGASLALAQCEGDGLRCLYHGWKFATDGRILETPNYDRPTVMEKLRAPVYPVREAGGLIWVYLGPKDKEPPLPWYSFMDISKEERFLFRAILPCNYVQVMEGTVDSSHVKLLHRNQLGRTYSQEATTQHDDQDMLRAGSISHRVDEEFLSEDDAPETEVEDLAFGAQGVFVHDAIADGRPAKYCKIYTFVLPFLTMASRQSGVFSVPVDDHQTSFVQIQHQALGTNASKYLEWMTGFDSNYDQGRFALTARERWGQDRVKMRAGSFSGIQGVLPEDFAVTASMGPIYDRTREHVVPADALIIRMRRRLLQAARDLQAGNEPRMLTAKEAGSIAGVARLLRETSRWQQELAPGNAPFRLAGTRAARGSEEKA